MQIIFLSGTKCLWLPQNVNKFLVWHKKFGRAQNILGPVKGQGINTLVFIFLIWTILDAGAEILQKVWFVFWEIWRYQNSLLRLTDIQLKGK